MRRLWMAAAVLAVTATLTAAKPKIKDSVTYATSWEAAVAEAKLLNVPIVVHRHGWT